MKNKKIWITAAFVILAAAVFTGILLLRHSRDKKTSADETKDFSQYEEAAENAGFSLRYSDRLSGWPMTGFKGSSTSITVLYGNAGYVRKTLISEQEDDAAEENATMEETSEHLINGVTVYFNGDDAAVTQARWTDNGFDYLICIETVSKAVAADVMEDYVRMTR